MSGYALGAFSPAMLVRIEFRPIETSFLDEASPGDERRG
jgi:hypothetical protein